MHPLSLPLDCILMDALPRDRSTTDEDAMQALVQPIVATGLRQPIEVWELSTPRDGCTHGLISGYRRLTAVRRLRDMRDDHTHIDAFLRQHASVAMAQMSCGRP